jgi:sugar O-acyltransferase (sialic acid O-acetyltransferase NeuD family)
MKQLIIIGAGGYGREISTIATQALGYGDRFVVKGFLDSKGDALDNFEGYPPILGDVGDYAIAPDDVFVCGIDDISKRQYCLEAIIARGGRLETVVHRSCVMGQGVYLGAGVVISYNVVISNDTTIGDGVLVNTGAIIGHDVTVGNFVSIGVGAFLAGGVTIGHRGAVNASATVHKGCHIGENATVGMSSTVVRDVVDDVTVFGTPAKVIFNKT